MRLAPMVFDIVIAVHLLRVILSSICMADLHGRAGKATVSATSCCRRHMTAQHHTSRKGQPHDLPLAGSCVKLYIQAGSFQANYHHTTHVENQPQTSHRASYERCRSGVDRTGSGHRQQGCRAAAAQWCCSMTATGTEAGTETAMTKILLATHLNSVSGRQRSGK